MTNRLLQTNATVTAVAGGGVGDTFEGAGAGGPEKFAGELQAYYQEKRQRTLTAEGEDRELVRSLVVPARAAIDWQTGDVVTFTYEGATWSGVVDLVERRNAPRASSAVATTRLTFAEQIRPAV